MGLVPSRSGGGPATGAKMAALLDGCLGPCLAAALFFASALTSFAQPPYRAPVYRESLWLPDAFIPAGFTADRDKALFSNPPRSNGSQHTTIQIDRSKGTGFDKWIWCFIDGMTLHQSAADAKAFMDFQVAHSTEDYRLRRVNMGDEAYINEGRLRGYLGQKDIAYSDAGGFLIKENIASGREGGAIVNGTVWRRNLLVDPIRIGRMTVGLRVEGHAVSQVSNGKWVIVRPTPTGDELVAIARQFVAAIDAYAKSQGWVDGNMPAAPTKVADSSQAIPTAVPTENIAPTANIEGAHDPATEAGVAVSLGTAAVGAVTLLGAGVMMLGMGVSPRDVIEGAMELFGGGATDPVPVIEPLTEAQREAAVDVLSRDWENVSPEELELLRTSPKWLKEAMQQTVPAVTIEEYQKSLWREGAVAGLKAAQTYIDAAVGIFSSATGNLPMAVHYTYWKNMLGGTSEGVADWVWGRNDRGLVRNVAEGFTRGSIKGGVELAVDFAAGKAISNPVAEYAAGQVGKYAVGAAGDAATDGLSPPGSVGRPLRAEGFFDTTSPVEKDILDALLKPEHESGGMSAPPLPYMAQSMVY